MLVYLGQLNPDLSQQLHILCVYCHVQQNFGEGTAVHKFVLEFISTLINGNSEKQCSCWQRLQLNIYHHLETHGTRLFLTVYQHMTSMACFAVYEYFSFLTRLFLAWVSPHSKQKYCDQKYAISVDYCTQRCYCELASYKCF